MQDVCELGLGWAWFVNDLRAFLPAWQEMELASHFSEEPVTQIEADVPIEPLALQADATNLDLDLHASERPLAVTPFGIPEVVPDWQDTHAMHAHTHHSSFGKWIRADLGVRAFQGLGKNSPTREQVVRRVTRDLHTKHILEDLACDSHLQVPLHRKCLPACGPTSCHTRDIETTFVYRLLPRLSASLAPHVDLPPSRLPSGGGGVPASFSKIDTSVRSTLGTQTLLSMRQFLEDAEKESEKETGTYDSELNVKDSRGDMRESMSHKVQKTDVEDPKALNKEEIMTLRMLFEDFEDRIQYQDEVQEESTSEAEESSQEPVVHLANILPHEEEDDELIPRKEPQLYLCDDWIEPVEVMRRPKELTARDKMRANVAKNCLIVTLMSLELGYGSILECYQQERNRASPALSSVILTN